MELILIRHGEPVTGDSTQEIDPHLTAKGQAQARLVAPAMQRLAPDLLIASGMARADQTAAPSAARLGMDVATDPRLAEVDAGGGRYTDLAEIRAQGAEAWQAFLRNPLGSMGGDGEEFRTRVLEGFSDIVASNRGKRVAVYNHGFPINLILSHVLGVDLLARLHPDHASITRLIGRSADNMMLVSYNETAHLASLMEEMSDGG